MLPRPWTLVAFAAGIGCAVDPVMALSIREASECRADGARWADEVVELVVDPSVEALGPSAFEAVARAAEAWQRAVPEMPALVVRRGPAASAGYRTDGKNQNVVRYEPSGEPRAKDALAITVLTYDSESGDILDADILLNGKHPFSATEDSRAFDLQNVLAHEIGHLLGLAEDTKHARATMYAYSEVGETAKRDLDDEDVARVAALYGPDRGYECVPRGFGGWVASSSRSGVLSALAGHKRAGRGKFRETQIGALVGRLHALAARAAHRARAPGSNGAKRADHERSTSGAPSAPHATLSLETGAHR